MPPTLSADSKPQLGVPQGSVTGPFSWTSEIYPGTERDYWVYVPAQYDGSHPACVLVVQDGLKKAKNWHLIPVLDNLIHGKEIPVTIGIFIDPRNCPRSARERAALGSIEASSTMH